jgi:type III secretory pathway component EscU
MAAAIDLTTPTTTVEWFGNPEHHTFLLEEIPIPDSKDLFVLIPVWILFAFIGHYLWDRFETLPAVLSIAALFIFGTVLAWMLWKLIMYYVMINRAQALGITKEQIIAIRESIMNNVEQTEAHRALIASSVISFVAAMGSYFGKND